VSVHEAPLPRPRLSIRPTTWRGEAGFLVCGRDAWDRRISIFTATRASAEVIRDKVKADANAEITAEDFLIPDPPATVPPASYTRRELKAADAAEVAVRRGEPGALDNYRDMPLCTLERIAAAFLGKRPPRVEDPGRVMDVLACYHVRVGDEMPAELARYLTQVVEALDGMQRAAAIPVGVFERYLESHGWKRWDGPTVAGEADWYLPGTYYPGAGSVHCYVPLADVRCDAMAATERRDRPHRTLDAVGAISATESRSVMAVIEDLEALAQLVMRGGRLDGFDAEDPPEDLATAAQMGEAAQVAAAHEG
jgi:hypothetical protein